MLVARHGASAWALPGPLDLCGIGSQRVDVLLLGLEADGFMGWFSDCLMGLLYWIDE